MRKIPPGAALIFVIPALLLTGWVVRRVAFPPPMPAFPEFDIRRAPLPVSENGFGLWTNAAWLAMGSPESSREVSRLLTREGWNLEQAQAVLETKSEALAAARFAMAMPGMNVPDLMWSWDSNNPYLGPLKTLSELLCLEAAWLSGAQKHAEAIELSFVVAELGHDLQHGGGDYLHYLVGIGIKQMAFRSLTRIVANSSLPASELRAHANRLNRFRTDQECLSDTVRVELRSFLELLEQLRRGEIPADESSDATRNDASERTLADRYGGALGMVFLDCRRTAEKTAGVARLALGDLRRPYSESHLRLTPESTQSTLSMLLRGNAVGELAMEFFFIDMRMLIEKKAAENSAVALTQALLATRAFFLENQRLPGSLSDLVPGFLAEAPIDDFDGQPLRYSPSNRVIYSIGPDLIDSGGLDRAPGTRARLDIPLLIEFPEIPRE